MKKYVLIGGPVFSANDGERHMIGPQRLAELYGVNPAESIFALNDNDPVLRSLRLSEYTVLRPDPSGRYEAKP
jgi:hypothetical protein